MKCPYCGAENKVNAKKCKNCKYSLDSRYTGIEREGKTFKEILPVIAIIGVFAVMITVGVLIMIWRFRLFRR